MRKDNIQTQILEMRRGVIVLVMLRHLISPHYGYELLQKLKGASFSVEAGTLYPLLRRLEKQGILQSEWETNGRRPRKYYQVSSEGERFYMALQAEWQQMTQAVGMG